MQIRPREGYYPLMADNGDMKALARLLLHQKQLLDVAYGVLNDHACFAESRLPRCAHDGCKIAATVRHADIPMAVMCDYHAARAISNARALLKERLKEVSFDPKDEYALDTIRARLASEECWLDLPDAVRIRRLIEHVVVLKKDEEPDLAANRDSLH